MTSKDGCGGSDERNRWRSPACDRWSGWLLASCVLGAALLSCGGPKSLVPEVIVDEEARPPVLLERLGDQTHPISTEVPEAQRYFDQGLILTFGFNHDAAVRSFREAKRLDPECAMCAWGEALAHGPNINAPMGPEAAAAAYVALQEATRLAPGASPAEQAYIAALANRYVAEPPADRSALDAEYARAMGEVHRAHPDDIDAQVLYAEALMDLYPWNYWTSDAEPREHTLEIVSLLEDALERSPDHVGANHYYIHAVEEYFPEKAETAADRLGGIAPDAGHLVHMPSHIYWRLGRYEDALEINRRAIESDEEFFARCRAGAFYQALYYPHNIHFMWAAASAEGQSQLALTTARKLAARTTDGLDAMPFLQEFQAVPLQTLARFGQWDAILGEPQPPAEQGYVLGIWHYVRGLALVRTGDLDGARVEVSAVAAASDTDAARELMLAGGTASAATLLSIGEAHLEGEWLAARRDFTGSIAALERAVSMQDSLVYMEPPPWYFPVRQALGAVLLEAGKAERAEAVYRKDLEQYPKNGWSLKGLALSLEAQGRSADASWADGGFRAAWSRADVELTASRF